MGVPQIDVWLLLGEEGQVYGTYESELAAWDAAALSAGECFIECGAAEFEEGESADDPRSVKLCWTVERGWDPDATVLTAKRRTYDPGVGLAIFYVQRLDAPGWLLEHAVAYERGDA